MKGSTLLFGGSGFIGTALSKALSGSSRHFTRVDRPARPREPSEAAAAIDMSTIWGGSPTANIALCLDNLAHARASGVRRFVYVSTGGAMYGNADRMPIAEDAEPRPVSEYARGKLACERALADAAEAGDIDLIVVRPANAYGRGHKPGSGQGLVTAAFQAARTGVPLTIFGDGSQIRDYVYIDDVATGILAALDHGAPLATYNIGTGIGTSVLQLLRAIERLCGPIPTDWKPPRDTDVQANVLDSAKLRSISDWCPRIALEDGLDLVHHALANRLAVDEDGEMIDASFDILALVPFDRSFLDRSWTWLTDPEIKSLTMTPDFTREDQSSFFEALPSRTDYFVWGLSLSGEPVGAAGLKNPRDDTVEYWGYIGEKRYWGRGLGPRIIALVESEARRRGFRRLDLKVSKDNVRALRLYVRQGFKLSDDGAVITMEKEL